MKRYTKIRTAVFLLTAIIVFLTLAIELIMVQTIFAQERVYRLNLSSIGAMSANGEGVATVNIELTDENGKVPTGSVRIQCTTTLGTMEKEYLEMVNGKAVNVFRAPKSENTVNTMISAVVVEADDQDMIGLSAVTSITLRADADSGKNSQNAGSTVNRDAAVLYVNALDTARVKIEFSGAIKKVSKDNFNISNGVIVVDVQLSDDGKSVTLLIEGAEYANTYTVSVQGLEQKNGGGVQESVLSFTIPSKSNENTQSDAPEVDVSKPQSSASTKAQKITYQTDAVKNGRAEYGTKFFLNARASGKGKLSYKSSDSKVLSVDASGKVTVKKYGHASITIKAASGNGYKAAQKIIKLIVVPKQVRITKAQWKKDNKAYFEWKQDKSADGYEYSFAYNPEFASEIKGESVGKQNHITMGNFKGLEQGGIYIRVRAFKKVGGNRYYSAWSDFRYLAL